VYCFIALAFCINKCKKNCTVTFSAGIELFLKHSMHPVLYHIATVFLLLLFPLKDISVCLLDCKQIAAVAASAEDDLPEFPEKKNNGEKECQYEFVPLYHHAGIIASMSAAVIITGMHRRFTFYSDALPKVPTPPPEIN
jgi:hypothetical protein